MQGGVRAQRGNERACLVPRLTPSRQLLVACCADVDYLLKTTEVGTELPFLGTVERCGQRKKYIGMTHPRRLLCKKACVQCPGLQDAREKTMGGVVLRGAPRQCTRTSYQG